MTIAEKGFSRQSLTLDVEVEIQRISAFIQENVNRVLRRQGAIVGISGGIDSSVVLGLCVHALGAERVLGVLLPEKESSPESVTLARQLADHLGVDTVLEDITPMLEGAGCYRRRDEAIRRVFPEYGEGWKCKIGIPGSLLEEGTLNVFSLSVISPAGVEMKKRLPPAEFLQIVAASNFKQRMRMAMLYHHAEARNYAVIGTANKNEHDLGFFVKYGDGGVDISPIQHLFKSQVYQLAKHLQIPQEIQNRIPTTDTYSAGSTQEEFFFRVPFEVLDLVWRGNELGVGREEIATILGLTPEQVGRVVKDILSKKRATDALRRAPITLVVSDGG